MFLLVLENVKGLAVKAAGENYSPLDWVCHTLASIGLYCFVALLDPISHFGFPASRPRLWILAMPLKTLGRLTKTAADGEQLVNNFQV